MPETELINGHRAGGADFGRLLLGHRRVAGLTQEKLAEHSGLSVRAISDLERGRARAPQRRSVEAIASALGLSGDARIAIAAAARAGRTDSRSTAAMPLTGFCELPPELNDLVGRGAEIGRLHRLAEATESGGATHSTTVVAVTGLPGVGKTSLAVRAAYELWDRFSHGVYFVDLRGMDPRPLAADDALERLLRSLGTDPAAIPHGLDDRAALYRLLVRERRILVVLDNARDEGQVRPLLPCSPSSLTIITSRQLLAGLEDVRRLALDVLSSDHAVQLLETVAGPDRIGAERVAASELVALCGHLPLALRIAGNRLARRPQWTIRYFAEQLTDSQRRLAVLAPGDQHLCAAFGASYQQLSAPAQLLLRRLALVPGPDLGPALASLATGLPEFEALEAIDELVDASLLQLAPREGQYRFHDLLRLFARERLAHDDAADAVLAAENEVHDWLLSHA